MKRFGKVIMLLALMAVICLPGTALASFSVIGDAIEIGSWKQRFNQSVAGSFDRIEARMITYGQYFESPGWDNFDREGWTSTMPDSNYAEGFGTAATSLYMDLKFMGDMRDRLSFFVRVWDRGTLKENTRADWDGWRWTCTLVSVPVPIPTAVWLLGTGLIGLVVIRRRMKK